MSSTRSTQFRPDAQHELRLIDAARAEAQGAAEVGATVAGAGSSLLRVIPQISNYSIVSEIGRGGQGIVYKAVQASTKRDVAVKVLLAGVLASDDARRRFEREMDLIAAMQHPNIVTVFDGGTTPEGHQWYAMEYIEGVRLDDYIRTDRRFGPEGGSESTRQLLELFVKICSAISYAHQHGVIHRDLKPGNIRVDAKGEPHILDFGVAKALGQSETETHLTVSGAFLGTLAYASPEQTTGDPRRVDTRTDVYSLGVILYELFTGHFPYSVVGTMAEVLRNIAEAPPERPSTWHKRGAPHARRGRHRAAPHRVDDELETIILKALAKEPDRRYATAEHLRRDLENYLTDRPIEARPDSALYVLRKLAVRNSYAAVVLALLFLSLLAFAFISFNFYLQTAKALRKQQTSDAIALRQSQSMEELYAATSGALHRLAFKDFLAEWREGRPDRARRFLARVPRGCPEHAAMSFLLDEAISPDALFETLGPQVVALGHVAVGERQRKAGRNDEAVGALRSCLATAGEQAWLADLARQALDELRSREDGAAGGKAP